MVELHVFGFKGTSRDLLVSVTIAITQKLSEFFKPIKMHPVRLPVPFDAYDAVRRQYTAAPFLWVVSTQVPPQAHGIGLVDLDLFTPQLNFIFGVAEKDGNAVVATTRLQEDAPDFALAMQRITKTGIHELGHVLGLDHCRNHCVMAFSNTLADTDQKPDTFCQSCREKLQSKLKHS